MDRVTRLLCDIGQSKRIVEIGPGYSPVAPKSAGWTTHTVDHATQTELKKKYSNAGVNIDLIEPVDSVWQSGPLQHALPASLLGSVDLIIASHVLEHFPDLLGFFHSASELARLGGLLSVALPDRRYCFDCLKPWTTTGEVLDAHSQRLNRHSLKTAYNNMAYSAVVDGRLAWGPSPTGLPTFLDPFSTASSYAHQYRADPSEPYQDFHAWQFSPAGFQLLMLELREMRLTDWMIEKIDGPENFEFFVTLRRTPLAGITMDAERLQSERRRLLIEQLLEAREQIDFILPRERKRGSATDRLENSPNISTQLFDHERRLDFVGRGLTILNSMPQRARCLLQRLRRLCRT